VGIDGHQHRRWRPPNSAARTKIDRYQRVFFAVLYQILWQTQEKDPSDAEPARQDKDVERNRVEKALKFGLEETLPASDPVAIP
jgi:hypothetical protein